MDRPGFESRRQKIESEGSRQQAGGSKQRAKGKEQRSETADRRLKTANSKVAFRSHSSRHRSSVICPGLYTLCAERYAPGAESSRLQAEEIRKGREKGDY